MSHELMICKLLTNLNENDKQLNRLPPQTTLQNFDQIYKRIIQLHYHTEIYVDHFVDFHINKKFKPNLNG